jgi:hypothetical protein
VIGFRFADPVDSRVVSFWETTQKPRCSYSGLFHGRCPKPVSVSPGRLFEMAELHLFDQSENDPNGWR